MIKAKTVAEQGGATTNPSPQKSRMLPLAYPRLTVTRISYILPSPHVNWSPNSPKGEQRVMWKKILCIAVLVGMCVAMSVSPTLAVPGETFPPVFNVPNGWQPEGIAVGRGNSFLCRFALEWRRLRRRPAYRRRHDRRATPTGPNCGGSRQ